MKVPEHFLSQLPDAASALKFASRLEEVSASTARRLQQNESLLFETLALASYSPWLAASLISDPSQINWLGRTREMKFERNKEELLESLARFTLTNSNLKPQLVLSRFKRREYIRIFLDDVLGRQTIAETTAALSELADAILENALRTAFEETAKRFGNPQEFDQKGRILRSEVCIVSIGKLGSKELNYASDIDLIFIYSADGKTDSRGHSSSITNREFFIKLAEKTSELVGKASEEVPAYRVDLRLRPFGRIGALAVSVDEAIRYYRDSARIWELQALIRSRASAGSSKLYRKVFESIRNTIYSKNRSFEEIADAVLTTKDLLGSRLRKRLQSEDSFDVKLSPGGIRDIEFITQALQLAFGGEDAWLRTGHTLIALARLSERGLISSHEHSKLSSAYAFLRKCEHLLQMEHGLQVHRIPKDDAALELLARKLKLNSRKKFKEKLQEHCNNVKGIFDATFKTAAETSKKRTDYAKEEKTVKPSAEKEGTFYLKYSVNQTGRARLLYKPVTKEIDSSQAIESKNHSIITPRLLELLGNQLSENLPELQGFSTEYDLKEIQQTEKNIAITEDTTAGSDNEITKKLEDFNDLRNALDTETYTERLAGLRAAWRQKMLEIIKADLLEKISFEQTRRILSRLANESIRIAYEISYQETKKRFNYKADNSNALLVLALGRFASRGLDYDSDLDLVFMTDDEQSLEMTNRWAEIFVNVLSAVTREGSLYRVDTRLRPYGQSGPLVVSVTGFQNYLKNEAAVWELLAYVKLRGIAGKDIESAASSLKSIIHAKGKSLHRDEIREKALRIRAELAARGRPRGRDLPDFKYSEGGMLDCYFAARYLQLLEGLEDDPKGTSTAETLRLLAGRITGLSQTLLSMEKEYLFLSRLDHELRLYSSRNARLPIGNQPAMRFLCGRLGFESTDELIASTTLSQMKIREYFNQIFSVK
jgi:glutamate-ammonia-ligase adenylyltransferase